MRGFIFILMSLMLLVGCRTIRAPQFVERTTMVRDTVEKVRDSLIVIPADSSWLKALLECDSNGRIQIKQLTDYYAGKFLKPPTMIVKDNYVMVKANIDSVAIYAKLKDRYFTASDTKYVEKQVEVNVITGWQNFQIWCGRIVLGCLLLFIIYYLVIRSPVGSTIKNLIIKK